MGLSVCRPHTLAEIGTFKWKELIKIFGFDGGVTCLLMFEKEGGAKSEYLL